MTSALQRLQANEDDTIWRQNASLIRRLYQEERKTLKEVKAIMENEKAFPVTPLSIWEVKLRRLGMQKKLKARDWSLVYQHVRPRLQSVGKKKLRVPTSILINDTKKPWDDVWKEIRRNCVLSHGPQQCPLPPLPHGIVSNTEPSNPLTYPDYVFKLCLQGIPFTRLLEKMSDAVQEDLPSSLTIARLGKSQDDQIISAFRPWDDPTAAGHVTSWRFQLAGIVAQILPGFEPTSPAGQELRLNFDSHHYLSMVIYLLSNDIVPMYSNPMDSLWQEVTMAEILQMTFTFVPRLLLLALLHSHLPSIKAAWEKLLLGAGQLKNKEAFKLLISVGIDNDWLDKHDKGHEYLFSAAQMNCSEILRDLIARGCRTHSYPRWCTTESIIVEALENCNLDCARLLIQHCDINHEFQDVDDHHESTHFAKFIMAFDDTRPDHLDCLDLFLDQGANVDYDIHPHYTMNRNMWFWDKACECELGEDWPFSILDYVSYCHHQGIDTLQEYLKSDLDSDKPWGGVGGNGTNKAKVRERKNHCLEVLLAEQFLLSISCPEENVWWSRVNGLSKLEIDLTWLSKTKELASNMLYATACLVTSDAGHDKESGLQFLRWLMDQGFQVKEEALLRASFDDRSAIFECLASFCDDLEKEGGKALACAVLNNRFDTTKRLLDQGVDPNRPENNVFERAARASTLTMMKYLVQRGAKPRTCEQGDQPSRVLMEMFMFHTDAHIHDVFNKVQYIIEEHITIDEPSCPSAHLLETCLSCNSDMIEQGRMIFEFLFRKGARLEPGSPLAVWIHTGGGHQLVQEMLDAGADPNAHSFDTNSEFIYFIGRSRTPLQAAAEIGDYTLVCMLMEVDPDVNRPALGDNGMTALQAICAWDPIRREERQKKEKIIALLLDNGAEVNATNAHGHTALFYAAQLGDLSSAFSLLKHGADVNVAGREFSIWAGTALDTAARNGRLDMVEFLLNANALSSSACSDGKDYDRAIQLAREWGHCVVSELICKHSADRKKGWTAPREQEVETRNAREHTPQALSLRSRLGTASGRGTERRLTPSETHQISGLSYALDEGMTESNTAASEAQGRGMSGVEATDLSRTRVIEEIEDEPPVAETLREKSTGEKSDGTVSGDLDTRNASSGPRGWLYQSGEQSWVPDEQQNIDPLVSSRLSTDVFMGVSEF
ncbi:hypothetical protein LA080_015360 [Diaporthe eres]|nr:hypothetical protein LA080_015360 [Diaporthe eres]